MSKSTYGSKVQWSRYLVPILTLKDNGGVAVAMSLAREIAAQGASVTIVSSNYHGAAPRDRPENRDLNFVIAPAVQRSRLLSMLLFWLWALAFSCLRRPRMIYTHIATALIPNFSADRSFWLAQDLEYRFFAGVKRLAMKRLFSCVSARTRLLVTSQWLAIFFRRIGCELIYAGDVGISKAMFGANEYGTGNVRSIDFLLIAKRGIHKRQEETRTVAETLARRGFNVTLIDQDKGGCRKVQSTKLCVLDAVSPQQMRSLFRDTVVFVCLSRAEGYGLTPLEALSMACQVVTTPTPSTFGLDNPALVVVRRIHGLVERTVCAALERHSSARNATGLPYHDTSCRSCFMEDWAYSAAIALRNTEAQ